MRRLSAAFLGGGWHWLPYLRMVMHIQVAKKLWGFMLGACLLGLAACENDPAEVDSFTRDVVNREEATQVEALMSQSGKLKAILKAPVMYRVKTDTMYTEFPQSIFVTFYNDSFAAESIVKARFAKYYEMLRKVYLRDSVVVYNFKGDTLFAEDLWWDQNEGLFYTDRPVKVRQLMQKIDGTCFKSTTDFKNQTICNARGPVVIPDSLSP
jgi:LPS export ABC transporter protein LptC